MLALVMSTLLLLQETKKFPAQGVDLMAGAEVTNATKVGTNYRIEKDGKFLLNPLPERMQSGSYVVKVYVLPLVSGFMMDFGKDVNGQHFNWPLELRAGKWLVKTGDGKELATPARLGQWTEVTFRVRDTSTTTNGVTESARLLDILVDGKPVMQNGLHSGKLTDLTFTTDEGSFVLGGVNLVAPEKIKR